MAANCTVHLPAAACAGFPNPRTALRTLLDEALGDGLKPTPDLPSDDLVRVSIYLSIDLAARLRGVAKRYLLPLDEIAAGLAYARFLQRKSGRAGDHPDRSESITAGVVRSEGPTQVAGQHESRQNSRVAL